MIGYPVAAHQLAFAAATAALHEESTAGCSHCVFRVYQQPLLCLCNVFGDMSMCPVDAVKC
jgi:hypothetical protein